jgi:hypothetical protein
MKLVLENNLPVSGAQIFENKIASEFVPTRLAAELLGISENALRIKVCRRQVSVYKFGRSLRFKTSEIVQLLYKKE